MNAFVCLGLEPRPWLDEGVVRAAHQAVLRQVHPDVVGGDGVAGREANEAAARLASPAGVLMHYLECHGQASKGSAQAVPEALAEAFMALAGPMNRVAEIRRQAERCETFLDRAALAEPALEAMEALRGPLEALRAQQAVWHERVRAAGASGTGPDWEQLRRCAVALAFLERWIRDADEGVFQMAGIATG